MPTRMMSPTSAPYRPNRTVTNGPDTTAADWRPVTAANDAPPRVTDPPELGGFPPPLATLLVIREPRRVAGGVELGSRLYGALDMVLGPRRSRPFSELMAGLGDADIPFRLSMLLEGGGMQGLDAAVPQIASSFLAFSSDDSMALRDAMRGVAALAADGHAVVRLRLGLLTWVRAEEGGEALRRRLSRLQQVAEGWGEMVFTPVVGDPLESLVCAVPGFCCGHTGEPALVPLAEALMHWPISRPAPLAREGASHLFRSPDGKPLPFGYEEGGDYGFELIWGLPGRGKSVLLNTPALAFCLSRGQRQLPLHAVIDIGPTSSGFISLIREALPRERKEEAGWFALQMTPEHAINPMDTQLGCREPLPSERAFLSHLLGLMVTPAGEEGVPDGLRELIGPTLTQAYLYRSDKGSGSEPRPYSAGLDREVDAALERLETQLPEDPLWWEVVDLLFEAGDYTAAMRAQRHAVPVLDGSVVRGAGAGSARAGRERGLWVGRGKGDGRVHAHDVLVFRRVAHHVWTHGLRHRGCPGRGDRLEGGGSARIAGSGPPDGRVLSARAARADAALVGGREFAGCGAGALPELACGTASGNPRDAETALFRRVPPDDDGRGGTRASGARCP